MSASIEKLARRIEREMKKVDGDGTYPCVLCGERALLETMAPLDDAKLSSLICEECENIDSAYYR